MNIITKSKNIDKTMLKEPAISTTQNCMGDFVSTVDYTNYDSKKRGKGAFGGGYAGYNSAYAKGWERIFGKKG